MSWSSFDKIVSLGSRMRFVLTVDSNILRIVWSLHQYCGTEVLAYIRKVKDNIIVNDGSLTTIVFYVLAPNPFTDIYIPKQKVSQTEVKVLEHLQLDSPFRYAVIHTHPTGISKFSNIDRQYINVNHVVSLLLENKQLKDAAINFTSDNSSFQIKPEIQLVQPSLSIKYKFAYLKEIIKSPLELFLNDLTIERLVLQTYLNSLKDNLQNIILGCKNNSPIR